MERIIRLHIEKLPEGVYLGTSDDMQGLLAQGSTIRKTIEIAQDVACVLLEMGAPSTSYETGDAFDLPIVIAA